ncbi:MAG: type II toxin-antitoxin system VapC family toxin [Anaerolineales bacterium]|nr:type II toxin-antitoxin system VapC family toxin [Anaerolineales bacterium]
MVSLYLFDTDTLSYVLRAREPVASKVAQHFRQGGVAGISIITYYEALRGMQFSGATTQKKWLERFIKTHVLFELDEFVIKRAADIHATLRRQGMLIPDADLLIGATAVAHNIPLVTNNTTHFQRIPNLSLVNWMAS